MVFPERDTVFFYEKEPSAATWLHTDKNPRKGADDRDDGGAAP